LGLAGGGKEVLHAAFQKALCLATRLLRQAVVLVGGDLIRENHGHHYAEHEEDQGEDRDVRGG
jgi:adenylylsulfate kinase-like enzyme